jgi:hypothetical protein
VENIRVFLLLIRADSVRRIPRVFVALLLEEKDWNSSGILITRFDEVEYGVDLTQDFLANCKHGHIVE